MQHLSLSFGSLGASASMAAFCPGRGIAEYHITAACDNPMLPFGAQLDAVLKALDMAAERAPMARRVFVRFFLSDAANQAALLPKAMGCAVSVVQQPPLNGAKVALWACLQQDMSVEHVPGTALWRASHGSYSHYWLGSELLPCLDSKKAAHDLLLSYGRQLASQGMSMADDCMRTWLFVRDVDVRYMDVVQARNEVFDSIGLTPSTHFIASTGINGCAANPKATVLLDAYAVQGLKPQQVQYLQAPSHLNPTSQYGVAFERGTAITYGDRRHAIISGTASIDNRGQVVHPGDVARQCLRMLENVEALLKEASASIDDLAYAIVYLRDPADFNAAMRVLSPRLGAVPRITVLAPVCRPGWLVEMECMAIAPAQSSFPPL